jgi:hypothetical protein
MSQSPSWIDPDLVRAWMEEGLPVEPSSAIRPPPSQTLPSDAPTQFSGPEPATRTPEAGDAPTEIVSARTESLVEWLKQLLADRPFFICDPDGLTVVRHRLSADRVVALHLERGLGILRAVLGPEPPTEVSVRSGAGERVSVIWCSTELGRMALGVYGDPVPSPEETEWIREGLGLVFRR